MHNQARFEVLLPLVEKLSEGGKLAKLMKQKVGSSWRRKRSSWVQGHSQLVALSGRPGPVQCAADSLPQCAADPPASRLPHLDLKVIENEELLAALDTTKKHLDNKEFVEAVQRQKKARGAARCCWSGVAAAATPLLAGAWHAGAARCPSSLLPISGVPTALGPGRVCVQADMELMDMAERDILPAMQEVRGRVGAGLVDACSGQQAVHRG